MTEQSGEDWYADSGASAHVTNSTAHLQQSQPYKGNDSVMIGDSSFIPITHTGSSSIASTSGKIPLKDVLVCPDITKSLLSVSKLTREYPCCFEFDCDMVRINDKETKKLLVMGPYRNGLYMLEDPPLKSFYASRQHSASNEVSHRRLGHPHTSILQLLSASKSILVNKSVKTVCEACQLSKSHRLPFTPSTSVSSKLLERIHCDLWGTSPVISVQGFRYYAIFVDSYSRFSWLFPLKLKSDFYSTVLTFQSLVENQFGHKIKIFQSDGGGEFVSKQLLTHLQNCGIQQFISCPHTPQQNGLAEHKHRHVTELGLAMLFQSKAPLQYWTEAFFTANFLINLLPTSTLADNKSPFAQLNGKQPDYTALRIFGCACYPTLRDYISTKFDPRSLTCVFLGYSEKYRGYRSLYPPTGRVYISRHVIFDENMFPFQTSYANLHRSPSSHISRFS